ncbi:MAG: hypothetical protein ACRCX2_14065 [Paraclostridium sp.]
MELIDEIRSKMNENTIIVRHCWGEFEKAYKSVDSMIKGENMTDMSKLVKLRDDSFKYGEYSDFIIYELE